MHHDRRQFLGAVLGGAAVARLPVDLTPRPQPVPADLPRLSTRQEPDETFWELVKAQFPLRDGLVIMNAANLCPAPLTVIETVERLTRDVDADASFHNRAKFGRLTGVAREGLAELMGADADEIAINRNTSEGNNTVVNGLDLGAGDEILLWDQNHPTASTSYDVKAERSGCTVRRVAVPEAPASSEEIVAAFRGALSPQTRLIAFSHVSNVSGIAMPAKELCALARSRGILSHVDGAQAFGALEIDVHDMGCDFYTSSSHKWFLGPKEAGVLYVRRERQSQLWASNVGVGWSGALERGAEKFDNLGQRDDAAVAAMGTAAAFHKTIGPARIERRIRDIVSALRAGLSSRVPGIRFQPDVPAHLSAGVLIFIPPRGDPRDVYDRLYTEHRVAGAPRGIGVRLSPHVYNTMRDVGRAVEAVAAVVG